MNCLVIIPSRMGSSRLPGKAMLPLDGKPVIHHEIKRATAVEGIDVDDVVVATTNRSRDDILEFTARDAGATVFKGSEDDVLGRIADAVEDQEADMAIRMNGDNPLISPKLLTTLKLRVQDGEADYASSKFVHTFPIGHNADAFTVDMISHASEHATSSYHREHVAQYFKDNQEDLNTLNVSAEEVFERSFIQDVPSFRDLRLTLDEADDYRLLSRIYDRVDYNGILDTQEAITYIVENGISHINASVEQRVW